MFNARVRWKKKFYLFAETYAVSHSFLFLFFSILRCFYPKGNWTVTKSSVSPARLPRTIFKLCTTKWNKPLFTLSWKWLNQFFASLCKRTHANEMRTNRFQRKISRKNRRQTKLQLRCAFTLPYSKRLHTSTQTASKEEWMRCVFFDWNVDCRLRVSAYVRCDVKTLHYQSLIFVRESFCRIVFASQR